MTIAQELRSWRKRLSIGRHKASQLLDVPKRTLERWEQGRSDPNKLSSEALRERMRSSEDVAT